MYEHKRLIPKISDSTDFFSVNFEVFKYNFSGLLYFIKQNDTTVRVVMTSEMGPKILDLALMPKEYNVNFVVRQMNRKIILNALYEDFGAICGLFSSKTPFLDETTDSIRHIRYSMAKKKELAFCLSRESADSTTAFVYEKKKKITIIEYFFKVESNIIDSVRLKHLNTRMNIDLRRINL